MVHLIVVRRRGASQIYLELLWRPRLMLGVGVRLVSLRLSSLWFVRRIWENTVWIRSLCVATAVAIWSLRCPANLRQWKGGCCLGRVLQSRAAPLCPACACCGGAVQICQTLSAAILEARVPQNRKM